MRDFKNITLSPIQIITSFVLITAVAVAACWPSITGIEEDTDLRLFLLIYVLTAIFIYYWFVNIYKHWINLYLDVDKKNIKPLVVKAEKVLNISHFYFYNSPKFKLNNLLSFDNFNVHFPFCGKLYILPDSIIFLFLNYKAVIFDNTCEVKVKNNGILKIIKNNKAYKFFCPLSIKHLHKWHAEQLEQNNKQEDSNQPEVKE